MTKFEVLQSVTGVKEFARLVFALANKAETPEKLENDLCTDLSEEGLQTIKSVAQRGDYPLSFNGRQ